jgi:spermidine synthase
MWKTFAGKCIYESTTGIKVFQNYLFRWLKFNSNAIQTLINRFFPQLPSLHYIKPLTLFARLDPATCCMLGLGGGGVAHALSPWQKVGLTVVESNAEIINIAKRYFMINRIKNLEVIHQNAYDFVAQTNRQFDHILVDLFNAENFPSECNSEFFFSRCRTLLSPEGVLAVNLANRQEQQPILQLIRMSFCKITLATPVQNSANIIVFASKNNSVQFLIDKLREHKKLKAIVWDSQWGHLIKVRG